MPRLTATLSYYLSARHRYGHGVHSPFAYRFVREILRDRTDYPEFSAIEKLRNELKKDRRKVIRQDYGAGQNHNIEIALNSVVQQASVRPKYGKLLFRISRKKKPARILELGTSLGISTLYLACGWPEAEVISIEGDRELCRYARENVRKLCPENVRIVGGRFSDYLENVNDHLHNIDLVFIDGDHRSLALLDYINRIRPALSHGAWMIIDDIHWSKDMEQGWEKARETEGVTLSIDLLQIGILFYDKHLSRQKITVRF